MFIRNLKKYITTFTVAAATASAMILGGCTYSNEPADTPTLVPPGVTSTPKPTSSPAPTSTPKPTPTPIVDLPEGWGTPTERTMAEKGILDVERTTEPECLNPLYCASEEDIATVDLTQLKLLYVDENGKASAGVDKPCFAYSIEKLGADEAGEMPEGDWEKYRISFKEGLVFADGTPITSDDVMFSLYALSDKEYKGGIGLGEAGVYGMRAYNTQIPESVRAEADEAIAAGITEEGTCPEGYANKELWEEVWGNFDEAGMRFTRNIIDTWIGKYCIDAYVQGFLDEHLTAAHIEAKESLQVLFAMKLSGFVRSYNYSKNTMRDCFDVVHELDTEEMTAETFWNTIKQYYQWNLSPEDGLNYERPSHGKMIEDYLYDIYCEQHSGVESIEGITLTEKRFEDGALRPCIDVIIDKDADIADLNFNVVEKAVYGDDPARTDILTGAGEYVRETGYHIGVMLTANENYLLGAPKQLYLKYVIVEPAPEEE